MTTFPSELKISETEEQRGTVDQNEETIDAPYAGRLQVSVVSSIGMFPVEGASVRIASTGDPQNRISELKTDESGQTKG